MPTGTLSPVTRPTVAGSAATSVTRAALICGLVAISGPAVASAAQTVWSDVSGQGRDSGQLQMADGQCQMYAQQQANQAAAQASSSSCRRCAALNVATILITRQNAYGNCMRSQGWVRAAAAPPPASGTVICADRTTQALGSGPPFCDGHGGVAGVR